MGKPQFENLRASSLWCNQCRVAMPVRERLLLVLADREIYDYLCAGCANSLGQREVTVSQNITPHAGAQPGGLLLLP
jgi:hypothetical protein